MDSQPLTWDDASPLTKVVTAAIACSIILTPVVIIVTLAWIAIHFIIKFW